MSEAASGSTLYITNIADDELPSGSKHRGRL